MSTDSDNVIFDDHEGIGRIADIPVRNLWLLMLYASELFRELENAKIAVENNPDDIPDLVAEMLCRQVRRRIQRNLTYGYQHREAVLWRVRGRIDLLKTERKGLIDRGKIACSMDVMTVDSVRNRYVLAALDMIANIVSRYDLAHQCRSLAARLRQMGVTGVRPGRSEISIDRFGRHDAEDRPMVTAAHLAFGLALPTEANGSKYLSLPNREINWLRKLYEKGIAGFYDVVLSSHGWHVTSGNKINWQIDRKSLGIDQILPSMRTDIVLDNSLKKQRIVIDTKFNAIVKRGWYREETLRSGYVYQIYAYLRSQESEGDLLSVEASGLLLHPSVGVMVNESVVIQNHEIHFATVDLGATAMEIRAQLLKVLDSHFSTKQAT